MKSIPSSPAVASALALLLTCAAPAKAQTPPVNPQIEIAYVQPTSAKLALIYERLKHRRVLETLQQFLSPLKIDRKLMVKLAECGATGMRYKRQGPVTICYEYIEQIERMAPRSMVALVQGQVTTEAAIVGPVVQAVLHEVAIAAFDILDMPVWGRLDDAADRIAAFILLQFGPEVAWNAIVGTAWFLSGSATAPPDYADVRGAIAQRYYTTLCIAYGGEQRGVFKIDSKNDPRPFEKFVGNSVAGSLPVDRAATCGEEYDVVKQGFDGLVMPHLDQALLEQVKATKWINFDPFSRWKIDQ